MRKRLLLVAALIALGAVVGLAYEWLRFAHSSLPIQITLPGNISAPHFSHVVVIIEENESQDDVIGNSTAPYINQLAKANASAANYVAVTHPSLPNYIALTSGTTAGITNDCNPPGPGCQAAVSNIADRLEQAGRTWKEYAESMPVPCYARNSGDYAVRHNPFLYYPDIADNAARCRAHVVPFSQFVYDLSSANTLPDATFITPNLCNDMHNCSIRTGDTWLAAEVPKILSSPAFTTQHSLLVIVWDESNDLQNTVPLILAGPAAKKGYVSKNASDHYSLLRTIENNWQLSPLTQNDRTAPLLSDMLR